MGIIIKQSVRGAIWSYLGIVVGYINVGIIMPQFFNTSQIGLVQLFTSVSLMFAQFGTLGFTSVINRMFPVFRNPKMQHNGFLFLALLAGVIGFTVSVAGFVILKPWIVESNIEKSPLLIDYLWLLMPLVLLRLLFSLLDNYNKVNYDAVTGTFWLEFMHKVINLLLIIVFALGWISFRQFFFGFIVSLGIPVIPLIVVLIRRRVFFLQPHFEFLHKPLTREIGNVMAFGFINGMAGIILFNIDRVFVNQYLSLSQVGIFGVCALFASLIRVPFNSISKIAIGIIAESWKRDDKAHIQEIYQKSAISQAIVGTLIFVGLMVNLHNIFQILPPVYSSGKWVLIIYAAGTLVTTTIGLAGSITETSKYFRFTTLFLALAIVIQFGLSSILIPKYGIAGAAAATMITLILNSLFQATLQRVAFGIYGINNKLLVVAAVAVLSYGAGYLVPHFSLIPDIIIRSGITAMAYSALIYFLKVWPEGNNVVLRFLQKMVPILIKNKK